jgi:rhomboid protease GluP
MEKEVEQAIITIWKGSWFIWIVVLSHIVYYVYSGMGNWDAWGGITTSGLDKAGSLRTSLVDDGEFWRLWASIFLHAGLLHLVLNMLNLYCLGILVEKIYGRVRFVLVYGLSGLTGSFVTWSFGTERTVGASGAIFGLIGMLLIFGWKYRSKLQGSNGRFLRRQLAFWSVVTLCLGFVLPMIDNAAHIGGLITGIVLGILLKSELSVS